MGGLIRREAAASPLPFSGERLTGAITGQVEIEHYHRYLLAREYCRGKDVLDVASGEGYGTAILAQVARSAVGIEYDQQTVIAARSNFQKPNLKFEQGDARAMQLADASVDVAVSFETLEHLAEQAQFLSELRRVLRPDGLLIISTPDRDAYSPIGVPPNPFHVKELTRNEFEKLLQGYFTHVTVSLQRALIGSVILGSGNIAAPLCFERRSADVIEASDHLARAPYMIALAAAVPLPTQLDSVYVYRSDVDTDPQVRFEAEMKLRAADARAAEFESILSQKDAEFKNILSRKDTEYESKFSQKDNEIGRLLEQIEIQSAGQQSAEAYAQESAQHAEDLNKRLNTILNSTAWRATGPLRSAGRRHPALARFLRQTAKLSWWTLTLQLPKRLRERRASERLWQESLQQDKQEKVNAFLRHVDPRTIAIPPSSEPKVSIIIPTFGQVDATLRCLASIAENPSKNSIEVLVVDDAYDGPEDTSRLYQAEGIQLIRNPTNLGFLLSCNEAARHARGRYIHFLNNDTVLNENSIDCLATVLDEQSNVGMVGSKLLFPDGTLQEAGGIIWSDASGWNYGRGQDPNRPEFNYLRETDYCSGASIMVRRELFEALGGFEKALAPAYYEDVDLAFRIRERGMKVLYQPKSEVVHFEGMSHGTDLTAGVKTYQVVNQRWIKQRWSEQLVTTHYLNGANVLRARDRARLRKVILVIDHYVLEPDRDAGSRSAMGIIESLIDAGWDVKFWPHNRAFSLTYTPQLEQRGVEVIDGRRPEDLPTWLRENGAELDYILINRPDVAESSLPHIEGKTDATLAYYGVDLHFARMRRQAELNGDADLFQQSKLMERRERRIWRQFDIVIYPSPEEANEVKNLLPNTLAVPIIPFCFDVSPIRSVAPDTTDILFVAGFAHPPNVDAALFLIREIIPKLEEHVGPLKVTLVGSNPTKEVRELASARVRVTGYVTDDELSEFYERSRIAVVPLRFGAGVKGKVVEALSRGVPLVTTTTGSQGIHGLANVASVHDDVPAIVAAMKRLLTDDDAWLVQSKSQLDFANLNFSRRAMRDSVLSALTAYEAASPSRDRTEKVEVA